MLQFCRSARIRPAGLASGRYGRSAGSERKAGSEPPKTEDELELMLASGRERLARIGPLNVFSSHSFSKNSKDTDGDEIKLDPSGEMIYKANISDAVQMIGAASTLTGVFTVGMGINAIDISRRMTHRALLESEYIMHGDNPSDTIVQFMSSESVGIAMGFVGVSLFVYAYLNIRKRISEITLHQDSNGRHRLKYSTYTMFGGERIEPKSILPVDISIKIAELNRIRRSINKKMRITNLAVHVSKPKGAKYVLTEPGTFGSSDLVLQVFNVPIDKILCWKPDMKTIRESK